MTKADQSHATDEQVPTNLRLVRLIEEVAQAGLPVSPPDLVKSLGLPKPTVHRLLQTAEAEGLVQRHIDGKSYGPGFRMRRLAANTMSSERIRSERLSILSRLAEDVGETCNIAIPDRDSMVYLDRVETHWPLRIQMPAGTRVPFHCTASGKMYLSSLRADKLDRLMTVLSISEHTKSTITNIDQLKSDIHKIRAQGYATDDQEFLEGMSAVAVPVNDDQDRLVCTLSIHAPNQRNRLNELLEHLNKLRQSAKQLEALLKD
jgi:DNA-binding IclR family transcriptional regulator